MIVRPPDEKWEDAVEKFWDAVREELPDDKKHLSADLRQRIEDWDGNRMQYDPDVIYHRDPADVAKALLNGGYQEIGRKPAGGDVLDWLRDQGLGELFADDSEVAG